MQCTINYLSFYRLTSINSHDIFKYKIDLNDLRKSLVGSGILDNKNYSVYYCCHLKQCISRMSFVVSQKSKQLVTNFNGMSQDKWHKPCITSHLLSLKEPLAKDASCSCGECSTQTVVVSFGGCPRCWFCAAVLFTCQQDVVSTAIPVSGSLHFV